MKPYLTSMSVLLSMMWLFALNGTLAALYSDGVWGWPTSGGLEAL